jgi:hypothetical protein
MSDKLKAVEILRDLYKQETLHIVGKGPSLRYLRAEHFGDGPVMTINEAILPVQALKLSNDVYSMQKDGCKSQAEGMRCKGACEMRSMVLPEYDVAVILQQPEYSELCLMNHPLNLYVDPIKDLNFEEASVMSIRMCIALAKVMGCTKIVFLCVDSIAIGNFETYDVQRGITNSDVSGHYAAVIPQVMEDLNGIAYEFITPVYFEGETL